MRFFCFDAEMCDVGWFRRGDLCVFLMSMWRSVTLLASDEEKCHFGWFR